MQTKICTFNVNGLGDVKKRRQILKWVRDNKISICLLQETHSTKQTENYWRAEWGYEAFFSGDSSNSSGLGILINNNFDGKDMSVTELIIGRLMILKIKIQDLEITIVNLYGPNRDNTDIFYKLHEFMEDNDTDNYIIAGDYNTILNPIVDKQNGLPNRNIKCRRVINRIIDNLDLTDIWRLKHENIKQFTWVSNHNPPIRCRLDYFLTSSRLNNVVDSCEIITGIKSDHSPVLLNMAINKQARGPGYFKMNNSILLDEEYKQAIKENINTIVDLNVGSNPNTLWEVIKGTIRNVTIKHSSSKKKKERNEEGELQKELNKLTAELVQKPDDENLINLKNSKKEALEELYDKKVNGLILRSKARWVEGGEKNTKYFSNLEKRNYESKIIHKLNVNQTTVTDTKDILEEQKIFYEQLYDYKEQKQSDYDFFPDDFDQTLSDNDRELCEGLITEEECKMALKTMKNNKSPGSDGITCEFYKLFWGDVGKHLVNSLNHSYNIGELTLLQKQSIITLLPKKDKDLTNLGNWRPISLLNTDYKIGTKVIANRLRKVLESIIDTSQTGFVKGRYIGENIRLLLDILDQSEENRDSGLLFFTDFEKAFDSINHDYIIKVLHFLNFGPSLINWVKTFYKNAHSCMYYNGFLSTSFKIKRGVRQGCPLSPYLFILGVELLSYAIRKNPDIKGIEISGTGVETKNIMFADDATFILNGSEKSFKTSVFILDEFEKISGLKLNPSKCTVLRIGRLRNTNTKFMENKNFVWTSTSAKTLGIIFHTDRNQLLQLNLTPKIEEFKKCLEVWKKRNLTTLGKITVIKTFALPKLIYPLTNLHNPSQETITDLKRTMNKFIWNSKVNKVSHNTAIKEYEEGGIKMIDIESFLTSIKASWVKRLVDDNNRGDWKMKYLDILNKIGGEYFFSCNCHFSHIKKMINNEFLRNVLEAWCKVNYNENIPLKNQSLWNNSKITDKGTPLFYKSWFEKGIKYIDQITHADHFLFCNEIAQTFGINNINFLKYHKLIACIPKKWKEQIKQGDLGEQEATLIKKIKSVQKPSQTFYRIQINRIAHKIKAHDKWEDEFADEEINWMSVHNLAFNSTIDTKLRNFQYKFLMRIIPTNKFLLKCKKVPSNLCDFCNRHIETQTHLFYDCFYVQVFWNQLSIFLSEKGINLHISKRVLFLGTRDGENQLLNFLIICAKYYIYCCKYKATIPTIQNFKHVIKQKEQIEKIISLNNNNYDKHLRKWLGFTS